MYDKRGNKGNTKRIINQKREEAGRKRSKSNSSQNNKHKNVRIFLNLKQYNIFNSYKLNY